MSQFETTNFITFGTIAMAIGGLSLAFGNRAGFFLLLLVGIAFYAVAITSSRKKRSSSEHRPDKKDEGPKRLK
jgi:heme O synthase-like polyprenyltransferase